MINFSISASILMLIIIGAIMREIHSFCLIEKMVCMIVQPIKKSALITGGSSGLGLAYAEILGLKGYQIIILARNTQRIDDAVEMLTGKGIDSFGISCDITNESQLKNSVEQIKNLTGQIDFLILNAGQVSTSLVSDYSSVTDLKSDLEVDLWGVIQSAYFFIPFLKDGSKILMTSSGYGMMGAAGYSTYCAAKAGIINFGESLRRELLHRKIGVYVVCPGDMDTPQFRGEIAGQPQWMKEQASPRKLRDVKSEAQKILSQCQGTSKFLILPDNDAKLLSIVIKILPRRLKDKLLDRLFPRPR